MLEWMNKLMRTFYLTKSGQLVTKYNTKYCYTSDNILFEYPGMIFDDSLIKLNDIEMILCQNEIELLDNAITKFGKVIQSLIDKAYLSKIEE